ncbi:MAG TPA: hypothetical protein VG389_12375 [Myxococcota bacterium]|jgi:hypothetical protein|nr:hypothetical protein [Myxococcota bacterium]
MASDTTHTQRVRLAKVVKRGKKRKRQQRREGTPYFPLKRGEKRPKE